MHTDWTVSSNLTESMRGNGNGMRIDVVQATVPATGRLDERRMRAIQAAGSPGTEIRIRLPGGAPTSISSRFEDAIAAQGVLAQVIAAEEEGADAVVVNCTADTAVQPAREAVRIPVIGVSEASFHLAAQLSDQFAVLTFAERIAPRFRSMANIWGLAHRLVAVPSIDTPLEELTHTDALAEDMVSKIRHAVEEDGAHLVILGCTDFELVADRVAARLQEEGLDVPLVKPFQTGVHLAESLVAMGISHSRLTYPPPRGGLAAGDSS